MKISILLPTYNGEKYISKAIESVLSQSFSDWELIIINDASKDKTAELLEMFSKSDERVKIITNETNLRLPKSLNKALKIAEGQYIARIDDDDVWSDNKKLEKQVRFLGENPEYGLVGTKAKIVDTAGREIGESGTLNNYEKIKRNILSYNPFCHSSVLFRKKILNGNLYDEKLEYSEDWDMWLRIGLVSKFANLDFFGVNYLKRDGMSKNKTKKQQIYYHLRILLKYGFNYPKAIIALLKLINYAIFY